MIPGSAALRPPPAKTVLLLTPIRDLPDPAARPLAIITPDTTPPTLDSFANNVGDGPIFEFQTVIYTVTFSDCMNGTILYDFPGLGLTGAIPITRVAPDNAALCEALQNE